MRILGSILFFLFCLFTTTVTAQTVINRGDLAIVAVNANLPAPNSSRDEISFVCFKDITSGTQLQLIDAGYENCVAGRWSGGQEGGALLTRTGGTIPAGTVITFRTTTPYVFLSPDNGWSVTDLFVHPTNNNYSLLASNFNINQTGDQIYMAQGGTWTEQTGSLCTINGTRTSPNASFPGNGGRILFGFSTSSSWSSFQQSSTESGLFPGLGCFSMAPTSGTAYNKYTGPLTPATQTTWITRISDVNNWSSYGSSATYTASGTNYAGGFSMTVLPGGDIPTAAWSTPTPMCSTAASIDLSTYITGTTGGTFSGTGVTGNIFNPSGLNGNYDIVYTIVYKTCPISQTNTITVNATPTQPTLNITSPTCSTPTGTVSVSSSTAGLTFSNDGVTYTNTTGVFAGIAAGAAYSITAKSAAGCISTAATGTMPTAPSAPTQPTVSVTPPDCTTPTGTITVTSTLTGLTFSSDGATYTNTTGIFSSIAGGASYSITAKNAAGCVSPAATGTMPTAPSAPTQPTVSTTPPDCTTPTGTITVTSTLTGLTFSNDGVTYTNTSGMFSGIAAGASYSITAKNAAGCVSPAATGTMAAAPSNPAQPTVNVTGPTCTVTTGTVTVTSSTSGLTFSNDGVTYTNTTGIFSGIPAGTSYSITAKNAAGCVSSAATGTMTAAPGAPATPQLDIFGPATCTNPTGTINVKNPVVGLTYSNDGINYTNTTGIFTGIAAGSAYSITAKNAAGCVSLPNSGNMTAAPGEPDQPTLSITPPTCTTPTGTITVTNTLTGLTYSIDGINYTNTTGIFPGIVGGTTYSITAKIGTDCISPAATGTMAAIPTTPSQPTVSITDPTCSTPTGTITVTSSLAGLTFSSDGINYTNTTGIFSGIPAGAAYSITAKNATGCISTPTTGTMTTAPSTPTQPTLNITPPTCTISTGTITVTSTLTGLTFSIDGINYTNTTGIFNTVAAGTTYSITAKNTTGCISAAATGTMPPAPAIPTAPTVVTTPPTCTISKGTITVTSSLTGLTFSIDGINYTNTTGIFNNLAGGVAYSITAKNADGCISSATTNTMAAAPAVPAQPTVSTTPPTCTIPTGTITVTSTLTGLSFSNDGVTYTNTSGIFSGIAANSNYSITAKNAAGCISIATTGTMDPAPATPLQPTVSNTPPTCSTPTGTITVTSTLTGLTFSNDGITYTNTTGIFPNIAGGTSFSITAKNATGCISPAATGTMAATPNIPVQPVLNITAPTCAVSNGAVTVTGSLTGLTFSSDGINYTNTTGVFSPIAAGAAYSITSKNAAGCVSIPTTGTMAAIPTSPATPIVTVTDPTCITPTATITVTNSTAGLLFSIDGINYTNTNGIFSGIAPGTNYSITSKNAARCVSSPATGTIGSLPTLTAPVLSVVNDCGKSIITATGFSGTLVWSDGGTGNPRTFLTATGPITATQTSGTCSSPASNAVSTAPAVGLGPNLGNDVFLCPGEKVVLNPGSFDQYTWQDNSIGKTFTVTQSGIYKVTVRNNSSSCIGKDSVKVTYFVACNDIYFPTAFTPNGDGLNDKFGPSGNLNVVTNYQLSIYNRYGELVFRSKNPFEKWDGSHLGIMANTGNFVWHAEFLFNGKARVHKGNLAIIR
ncbi:gliding motility-associated C-terminal domain-containing protein [Ferruginibacter sp. SUN002]|uniref:T9SS type B sorting domain-containing protein n=1 Tax=Ferruginibacter sp. SUN002 TaxID=2937789 RepID=UPI003D361604